MGNNEKAPVALVPHHQNQRRDPIKLMSKVIWSGTAQMTMSVLAGHGCIEDTTAQRCGGKDTYAEHTGPSVLLLSLHPLFPCLLAALLIPNRHSCWCSLADIFAAVSSAENIQSLITLPHNTTVRPIPIFQH